MRKNIKITSICFVCIILTALIIQINSTIIKNKKLVISLQNIPSFNLQTVKSNRVSNQSLFGKKSVLIYYDINCSFCEAEATQIRKNCDKLKGVNIVFISENQTNEIIEFRDIYELNSDDIIFAVDQSKKFYDLFGVKGTPTIFIYNEQGLLIKRFNGSVHIDKILDKLFESEIELIKN